MKKNVLVIIVCISLIVIISLITVMYFKTNSKFNANINDNITNNNNETMKDIALYINSTIELKEDTHTYKEQYVTKLRTIFDILNENTDVLLNAMFESINTNTNELINNIKNNEYILFEIIDTAYYNAKSKQYKMSYTALKKYIKLQNETIFLLEKMYKKEGQLSYKMYYDILHTNHNIMTLEEQNSINFLTAVDKLIE